MSQATEADLIAAGYVAVFVRQQVTVWQNDELVKSVLRDNTDDELYAYPVNITAFEFQCVLSSWDQLLRYIVDLLPAQSRPEALRMINRLPSLPSASI